MSKDRRISLISLAVCFVTVFISAYLYAYGIDQIGKTGTVAILALLIIAVAGFFINQIAIYRRFNAKNEQNHPFKIAIIWLMLIQIGSVYGLIRTAYECYMS